MGNKPKTLYGNSRELLEAAERKNELLAQIAGETYTNDGNPSTLYNTDKALLAAAQKENELLEAIAEGGAGGNNANKIAIDYATDVISLKHGDTAIPDSGATLPAYGLTYDSGTGGLTLTKNGTGMQGQTVSLPPYGAPNKAESAEDMTDTDKVYVYVGETTADLTNGDWYVYGSENEEWVSGGVYNAEAIVTDTTLSVPGMAADAAVTGGEIAALKTEITYVEENGAYQVTGIAFESGRVNDAGEEVDNANYSRTVEYISISNIKYLISSGAGFTIRYFNYVNDAYVYQASKYVNNGNTQVLNTAYGYFRIDIGVRIANHPEEKCLFYKYTADRNEINAIKNREIGKYKSPVYMSSGAVPTWKLEYIDNIYVTTLTLEASYVIFEGYSDQANFIAISAIKDAATASEYTTVSGNDISGSNYAIVYNISGGTISIVQATTYKHNNSDEIVLFAAYLNSFVSGYLVDYAIRHTYRKNTKTLSDIQESIDQNLVLPDYWREYIVSKIGDVQTKDLLVGNHGDSFIFCTDQHYASNDGNSAALINYIRTHSSVSTLVMGGDLINGRTSGKQGAINDLIDARNRYITFSPKYLRGNHDNNTEIQNPSDAKAISDSELYAIIMKPVENEVVADGNLYYYFENEAQKIRYICLDTGEPGSKVFSQPDPETGEDTDPQIIWMKARITELESGWTVVILTHKFFKIQDGAMVPDGNGIAIMNGLNNIYDTSDATIACVIAGHSHQDYSEVSSKGYPIIAVTCDVRGGEQSGGTRTDNTTTEQAMDVFHIDTQNRDIYATRIGFGEDRTFSY